MWCSHQRPPPPSPPCLLHAHTQGKRCWICHLRHTSLQSDAGLLGLKQRLAHKWFSSQQRRRPGPAGGNEPTAPEVAARCPATRAQVYNDFFGTEAAKPSAPRRTVQLDTCSAQGCGGQGLPGGGGRAASAPSTLGPASAAPPSTPGAVASPAGGRPIVGARSYPLSGTASVLGDRIRSAPWGGACQCEKLRKSWPVSPQSVSTAWSGCVRWGF